MIVLNVIVQEAINPGLKLLPAQMDSDAARVMLLATGLQESRFKYRFQTVKGQPYVKGPAKSYWQFEVGGAVKDVMQRATTRQHCIDLCAARAVAFDPRAIHSAMEEDDILAAAMARLLLWTDSKPLPNLDASHEDAWQCYVRNWHPGKPHRDTWDEFHAQAKAQVLA